MFMETDFATGPAVVVYVVREAEYLEAIDIGRWFTPEAIESATRRNKVRAFMEPRRDRNSGLSEQDRRDFKFLRETHDLFWQIIGERCLAEDAELEAWDEGRHTAAHSLRSLCATVAYDVAFEERMKCQRRLHRAGFGWVEE